MTEKKKTTKKTDTKETPEKKKPIKKTAAKKPAVKKPAAKKPASKKPAEKKTSKPKTKPEAESFDDDLDQPKRKFIYVPAEEVKATEAEEAKKQEPAPAPAPAEVKPVAAPAPEVKPAPAPVQAKAQEAPAPKPVEAKPAPQPAPKPEAPAQPVESGIKEVKAQPQQQQQRPVWQDQRRSQKPFVKPGVKPFTPPQKQQPKPKPKPVKEDAAAVKEENVIKIVGNPTVKELAEKMNIKINDFIKKLMALGIFATINQRLDPEILELVVADSGFKIERAEEFSEEIIGSSKDAADDPALLKPRPPVVTIMGHVDHGKTSLLDAIRESNVVEGEFGAITQHIGAYQVKTSRGVITFLDTPGHEAFTAMRARGAQATDIVILVVSATDGIMPQTLEAIDHAKAAGAPIIVAVNKIDLPGANPEKVMQELAQRGLTPEEWQGSTIYVNISAKKRINIDKLLEMVSLQAEMMDLKAVAERPGVGVILESKRDNKRGVVATVLVQKGTMKVGDPFIVGTTYGKIRALVDENGNRHQSIGPSKPAEILGISGEPPLVGDLLYIAESEKEARYIAEKRKLAHKADSIAHKKQVSLMNLGKSEGEGGKVKKLNIILKSDVQGSIEAIKDALHRIPTEEVEVSMVHASAGNINTGDILLAKASEAVIIGFNVDADAAVRAEAEKEGIEIRTYNIIFELIEDIRAAMEGLLEPDIVEVITGKAVVRQVFNLSSGIIAGSLIESGKITRGSECKVIRGGEVVWTGRIGGLKRFKDDVKEVEKGFECGILLDGFKQIKDGDIVETFRKDTITRRIAKN